MFAVGYSHKVAHLDPDITFIVQNHRIRGHASLLSNISPVFRSMFFGPMYSEGDIVITDTKPEVFQMFMKVCTGNAYIQMHIFIYF